MHKREFFQRGANAQGAFYLRLVHGRTNLQHLVAQLGKCQMAVRISKHRRRFLNGRNEGKEASSPDPRDHRARFA